MKNIILTILVSFFFNYALPQVADTQYMRSIEYVLKFEGGWFAEEQTNFGIMQQTYNQYRKSYGLKYKSVRYITKPEVYEIYYTMYYLTGGCDTLPPALSLVHLDACINYGITGAKCVMNKTISDYYDPVLDKEIALLYINQRRIKYREIVMKHPYKKKFLKGWFNRCQKLENIINDFY